MILVPEPQMDKKDRLGPNDLDHTVDQLMESCSSKSVLYNLSFAQKFSARLNVKENISKYKRWESKFNLSAISFFWRL